MKVKIKVRSMEELYEDRQNAIKILARYSEKELLLPTQAELLEKLSILSCVEVLEEENTADVRCYTNVGKIIRLLNLENFFSIRKYSKCRNYDRYYAMTINVKPALLEYLAEEED